MRCGGGGRSTVTKQEHQQTGPGNHAGPTTFCHDSRPEGRVEHTHSNMAPTTSSSGWVPRFTVISTTAARQHRLETMKIAPRASFKLLKSSRTFLC